MLIVSGRLRIRPGRRTEYLTLSNDAVRLARQAAGCRDFVVAADPLDEDRVNVYEEWDSEESLLAFRNAASASEMFALIEWFDVARHSVAWSGPA